MNLMQKVLKAFLKNKEIGNIEYLCKGERVSISRMTENPQEEKTFTIGFTAPVETNEESTTDKKRKTHERNTPNNTYLKV